MTANTRIGWIGIGRMGYAMAARLAKQGADLTVWNRTRAKAEPLAKHGAKIASALSELAACDIVFVMVSTWDDVREVIAGPGGLLAAPTPRTRLVVECSSISLEGSAELRSLLAARGIELLAAPVSGNAKVIEAGRLSFVCSGPRAAFDLALPYLRMIAPAASYVGEGELARIVKICHNVFLGVVIQSLAEITILAQNRRAAPRLLDFINRSVMGSTFTRYKTPALVNLDFKVTFTPALLRKDLDLGLHAGRDFDVPMPLASITRDQVQALIGLGLGDEDFAKLIVLQARASGIDLDPENVPVNDGLA
jgi:3-hydroxyisobutyrate dehydrogenase-like beta-hydroxyacid dehydrogenase